MNDEGIAHACVMAAVSVSCSSSETHAGLPSSICGACHHKSLHDQKACAGQNTACMDSLEGACTHILLALMERCHQDVLSVI